MKRYLLLAAGVCTLLYFVTAFFDPRLNPVGLGSDGYEYWHLSSSILTHNAFAYTGPEHYPIFDLGLLNHKDQLPAVIPCTTRVPGYPLVLAAGRILWDSPWTAIVINILAYIGLCLYGFRLGDRLLFDARFRRIFSVLVVFQPLLFVRWGIGADVLAAFFLAGFTYHVLTIARHPSIKGEDIFWASLFGAAANMTRSNLLIFTLTLAMGLLLVGLLRKNKRTVSAFAVVFLISATGPALWMARNKALTGAYTLSTQGGAVLYTVQLAYDLPQNDPIAVWKTGKARFMDESIARGVSFNRAEALLDLKLRSVVHSYYREHPIHLVKKWVDGVRTLFFFSYFDISDAILVSRQGMEDRVAFANSSSSEYQNYNDQERSHRNILFQISRVYKWLLALSFFLFPVTYLVARRKSCIAPENIALYASTFIAIGLTALFTGAGGDRMRLPFGVLILLFGCLTANWPFKKNDKT